MKTIISILFLAGVVGAAPVETVQLSSQRGQASIWKPGSVGEVVVYESLSNAFWNVQNGETILVHPGEHQLWATQFWAMPALKLWNKTNITVLGHGATLYVPYWGTMLGCSNVTGLEVYGLTFRGPANRLDFYTNAIPAGYAGLTNGDWAAAVRSVGFCTNFVFDSCTFRDIPNQLFICANWRRAPSSWNCPGLTIRNCDVRRVGQEYWSVNEAAHSDNTELRMTNYAAGEYAIWDVDNLTLTLTNGIFDATFHSSNVVMEFENGAVWELKVPDSSTVITDPHAKNSIASAMRGVTTNRFTLYSCYVKASAPFFPALSYGHQLLQWSNGVVLFVHYRIDATTVVADRYAVIPAGRSNVFYTGSADGAIHSGGWYDVNIHDNYFEDIGYFSEFDPSAAPTTIERRGGVIRNNTIRGVRVFMGVDGAAFPRYVDTVFENNVVDGKACLSGGGVRASSLFYLMSASRWAIKNNQFYDFGQGYDTELYGGFRSGVFLDATYNTISNISLINNVFDTGDWPIAIRYQTVTNNSPVRVQGVDVVGNTFRNIPYGVISVWGSDIKIKDNVFQGWSTASSNSHAAIFLKRPISGTTYIGSNVCDNVLVLNNVFNGRPTGGPALSTNSVATVPTTSAWVDNLWFCNNVTNWLWTNPDIWCTHPTNWKTNRIGGL